MSFSSYVNIETMNIIPSDVERNEVLANNLNNLFYFKQLVDKLAQKCIKIIKSYLNQKPNNTTLWYLLWYKNIHLKKTWR